MQIYIYKLFFILITTILLFTGCSNDVEYNKPVDDSTVLPDENVTEDTVTGQFIDAAVEGLDYLCTPSNITNTTNEDGNFTCNEGDKVKFKLGYSIFGPYDFQTTITPYTIFPDSLDKALNLARLLQSIDLDNDHNNDVITINTDAEQLLPQNLDYGAENFDEIVEGNLSALDITLVSSSEAQTRLDANILAMGGTVPDYNTTVDQEDENTSDEDSSDEDSSENNESNNTAPVINIVNEISVNENQVDVLTATASDAQNDTLSFYLDGSDQAEFDINSTSGKIVFNQTPDYEVKDSYSIIVGVRDLNLSDEENLTITILNIEEVPTVEDANLSINENLAANSTVGSVIPSSHGDSNISNYTITGTGSENFTISTSGVVTTNNSLDYESTSEYSLKVKATNSVGQSSEANLIVNVTNVADVAPVLVDTSLNIREDAVAGNSVGSVTLETIGDTTITSAVLNGTGSTNFELANDGAIKVKSGASFDYETTDEYNLTAQMSNSVGSSDTVDVYIKVNNVIDEVAVIADSAGSVDENATVGTSVGTLTISKAGDSNITKITLSGTGNENFSVANDGAITVAKADVLDHETKDSYELTAVATNLAGNSQSATITIDVNNTAEVPILEDSSMSIMENKISGAEVGSISIDTSSADSGDSDITSITLSGLGEGNFTVDNDGLVTLSANSNIDYETKQQYTLTAVATNAAGDSDSVTVTIDIIDYDFDPTLIAELNASDATQNDKFGNSIAIDGDYILVGASFDDAGTVADGGGAYLYKKDKNGSVEQLSKLTANVAKIEEYFGSSVDMENGVMVIGAPDNDSVGAVYIFELNTSDDSIDTPAQQLVESSSTVSDRFGTSVAISGDYIVIGAPGKASAYLYELDENNTAVYKSTLNESLTSADNYGVSVDIEGNYIVIGADQKSSSQGSAYVYKIITSTNVTLVDTISSDTPVINDHFGRSVAVSSGYVSVGAYSADELATNSGNAFLYKINANSVSLVDTFAPDSLVANDYFGYSVSMDGEYIVVGAHKKDSGSTTDSGSAYVYHIDTDSDTVTLNKTLELSTPSTDDYFGTDVAIDGDFIGVGSINRDNNLDDTGSVYIYDGEPVDVSN